MKSFRVDQVLELDEKEIEKRFFAFKHEYGQKYDHDRKGQDVRRDG